MKSAKRSLYELSVLAVAFFGLIGAGILLFGQQPEAEKTGVPDDWSHHHLIFSNPGTATQAIADGRFLDWYKTTADPRYRLQQLKRGGGTPDRVTPIPVVPSRKKNTLARDWSLSLGGSTANVAAGMTGGIFEANPSTPSCTADYLVFGVAATPGTGQPNIVGLSNLYIPSTGSGLCSGTTPSTFFSYKVGTGPVITSPTLGLVSGEVLYVESASPAVLHVLKGAGASGSNGTIGTPVAPAAGNGATDTAITLNLNPTVTYSSVFYDYGDDLAFVGDDSGYLHKFKPVFGGTLAEVVVNTGSSVWPAKVSSSGGKLTSPVLDTTSGRVYVSDGAYLCSVSPALGSASGGVTCTTSALGSNIVDAPIVDSSNKVVYVFVGSVPEVAAFSIASGNITLSPGSTASIGSSSSVPVYDGDFNNTYYSGGTGTLYACGNTSGHPTLYSVTVASGVLSSPTAGPVLANSTTAACSPLVEFYNGTTDWLFGGVPANSCGAGTGTGGCVMSFDINSATPNYGPWMPSYAFPATSPGNEIVDTNGNLQKCTSGCGLTGGNSGTSAPSTWSSSSTTPTLDGVTNASAVLTVNSYTGNLSGETVTIGTGGSEITLTAATTTPAKGTVNVIAPYGNLNGDTLILAGTTYTFESRQSNCIGVNNCIINENNNTTNSAANIVVAINGSGTCGYKHSGDTNCVYNLTPANNAYVTATNASAVVTLTATQSGTSAGTGGDSLSMACGPVAYNTGDFGLEGGTGTNNNGCSNGNAVDLAGASDGSGTAPSFLWTGSGGALSTSSLATNIAAAITTTAQTTAGISKSVVSGSGFTISGAGANQGAQGNTVAVGGTQTTTAFFSWLVSVGGASTTALQGGVGLLWTYQSASNGQTTAAAPTGTSGLIIDNSGATAGESNIYFGTLSGTGTTHSAVKMSQSGLK